MMWPIIACSIIAVAIILERLWTLQDRRILPPDLTQKAAALLEAGQVSDKVIQALSQNSPLGRVLAAGLEHRERPHAIRVERVEDTGRHVVFDLERYLNTLGTIAGISPFLGLLGTVSGIIKSFNAVTAGGLGDPQALSGGIAEALVCTAAGLGVAIPALIAFRYLRGRVERLAVAIEKEAMRLSDAMEGVRLRDDSPLAAADLTATGAARVAAAARQ
jgi:biopolymer transport protein ExbB